MRPNISPSKKISPVSSFVKIHLPSEVTSFTRTPTSFPAYCCGDRLRNIHLGRFSAITTAAIRFPGSASFICRASVTASGSSIIITSSVLQYALARKHVPT